MIYAKSADVEVFPSTKRSNEYASQSRLLSEKSFSRLVNQLVNKDSFIINYDSNSNLIEFNIHGYYFKINSFSSLLSSSNIVGNLYACIKINNTTQELAGQDNTGGNYEGVYLTTEVPSLEDTPEYTIYSLFLGSVSSNKVFTENADSYIMFNMNKIDLKTIDCGIIDE